jgi:hypothetical protein
MVERPAPPNVGQAPGSKQSIEHKNPSSPRPKTQSELCLTETAPSPCQARLSQWSRTLVRNTQVPHTRFHARCLTKLSARLREITTMPRFPTANRKRWSYLALAIFLTLLVAIIWQLRPISETAAIAQLLALGCDATPRHVIAKRRSRLADDDLALLQSIPDLRLLALGEASISDHGLEHVAKLQTVENLHFGVPVTCGGLVRARRGFCQARPRANLRASTDYVFVRDRLLRSRRLTYRVASQS